MQENKYDCEPHWFMHRNFLAYVMLVPKIWSKIKNRGIPFRGEIDHLSFLLLLVSKSTLHT